QWLSDRLLWMDSQFVAKPTFSVAAGDVPSGTQVTIAGPAITTIYYTLDGTDPRLPGGGIKPGALTGTGPITINANTKITARAKNNLVTADLKDDWSAPTTGVYVIDAPDLILSEIMYNPLSPPGGSPYTAADFEFVEVTNVGGSPLNLNGYKFDKGITYTFGNVTLNAGQSGVVVKNPTAFATRYPGVTTLGTFTGDLDNGGENIRLVDSIGVKLFDGKYEDDWEPQTDGNGYSLVTTYQSGGGGILYNAGDASDKWRSSAQTGGNPGAADTGVQAGSVVINEIMTNGADFIELYNTTSSPINVG